jgi:hypothetical protein
MIDGPSEKNSTSKKTRGSPILPEPAPKASRICGGYSICAIESCITGKRKMYIAPQTPRPMLNHITCERSRRSACVNSVTT